MTLPEEREWRIKSIRKDNKDEVSVSSVPLTALIEKIINEWKVNLYFALTQHQLAHGHLDIPA